MTKFNKMSLFSNITFIFAIAVAGCGGGGGGSSSGSETSGLTYSGVTTPAQVDETNAEEITGGAFATGLIGDGMVGLSVDQPTVSYRIRNFRSVNVPIILSDSLNLVDFNAAASGGIQAATQTASDDIAGNCGGTMSYSISYDDQQGTFSGSFTFTNYCNDGTTMNGAASFDGQIDVNTEEFIEATFTFDNLTGGDLSLDGEILIDFSATSNVITFNAYGQDPTTGAVFWIRDYSITIDEFAGFVEIIMVGTFYHPDFGYVTLTTPDPLVLHDGDEWPESGTLIVTGANNSKAKLTAFDHSTCTVEVDGDGDGTYEWNSGVVGWEEL
jgi:hypothetical protein